MAQELNEYLKKFNRCILEYTSVGGDYVEEDDPNAQMATAGPNAMAGGDPMAASMPAADPNAMGGDGMDMNGDGMPDGPNAIGGSMPAQDPNAMAAPANGAPGFNPQGADPNAMQEPIQTEQNMEQEQSSEDNSDEVNALKDGQKEMGDKLDALTSKFDKLMGALDSIEKRITDNDERIDAFKAEMEKRNPTSLEKMSLRTQKSGPFTKSPEEYWQTDAPDNYSPDDDNNGVGQEQYEITKDDIDNISDWQNISKTFDDEREMMGLRNLLGY